MWVENNMIHATLYMATLLGTPVRHAHSCRYPISQSGGSSAAYTVVQIRVKTFRLEYLLISCFQLTERVQYSNSNNPYVQPWRAEKHLGMHNLQTSTTSGSSDSCSSAVVAVVFGCFSAPPGCKEWLFEWTLPEALDLYLQDFYALCFFPSCMHVYQVHRSRCSSTLKIEIPSHEHSLVLLLCTL